MKTVEQIAEENERRVAQFTNIDKEDFTHAFRGIKITVRAGQSYIGRFPEVDHLAIHLARKVIAREKKAKGADKDYKGTFLYTPEEIEELKGKIIQEKGTEVRKILTPEEERKRDLERLQEKYEPRPKVPEVTKADVIKSLKERGITPDITKSKEELLKQLMEAEATGQ